MSLSRLLCIILRPTGNLLDQTFDVNVALAINLSLSKSRLELVLRELVAPGGQTPAQLFLAHLAALLIVEALESVLDDSFIIHSGYPVAEDAEEHGEIDGSGCLAEHLLEVFVAHQSAERIPGYSQIVLVDQAILVGIDEREGLLELGDLVLREHGEHI